MNFREIPLTTIDGDTITLNDYRESTVLVVNVASKCGFTRQYAALESMYQEYKDRGFVVLGFPCNQFLAQEPGSADDIKEFCSINYGVTFPLMEKVKVNGKKKHPLFEKLHTVADADGKDGRVKWNFEKFVILPTDEISRFRSAVEPDSAAIVAAIEKGLD